MSIETLRAQLQRRADPKTKAGGAKRGTTGVLVAFDWLILVAGAVVLAYLVVSSAQANIRADAVDYYAILQRLTPADETPIARNLPFLEQRSPGYPIAALGPYLLLSALVEPLAETEMVVDASPSPDPPTSPPAQAGQPAPSSGGRQGSEFVLIPPVPVLVKDLAFNDYYVPAEGSRYQWTLALALAATSYLFLFLGLASGSWTLRHAFPAVHGVSLPLLSVFTSALFMQNVLATPLYATLTAYGLAALFALFFERASASGSAAQMLPAGFFLGFLALTRLELGILAAAVAVLLLLRRQWWPAACLTLGAGWALAAWMAYNAALFGTPLHLGILKGDINTLALDAGYIADSLVHPASGVLWWTPMLIPGLLGLLLSKRKALRTLGIASAALLALYLVRVPVMYRHLGESILEIGGIAVTVPDSPAAMRELIRSDINRYATVLLPFAVLGLRDLLGRLWAWAGSRAARRKTPARST